jgi:hypothetical protein
MNDTPRSLGEAIKNAANEWFIQAVKPGIRGLHFTGITEQHVVDFLSQKFTIAIYKDEQSEKMLKELFISITGREIGAKSP